MATIRRIRPLAGTESPSELFLHQAILATRKRTHRIARPAPRFGKPGEMVGRWIDSLPFELTRDQLGALDDVDADLDRGEPMQRLLMGRSDPARPSSPSTRYFGRWKRGSRRC